MRTSLNLSRQPFSNHRLLWIALVAVFFVSLWLLLWMSDERGRVLAKETDTRQRIEAQKQAAEKAREEQEKRKKEQQKVALPEQQAIQLAAARQLIQRKRFSWNRMISDIEEYVPKNTRILSIKVEEIISTADEAIARLQVKAAGNSPAEMTEMMSNLEKSGGLFEVGDPQQETTTENGETPFTLNLTYKPSRGAAK